MGASTQKATIKYTDGKSMRVRKAVSKDETNVQDEGSGPAHAIRIPINKARRTASHRDLRGTAKDAN